MAKLELEDAASGYNLSILNYNLQKVESEFKDKTVYRNEVSPMERDFDMNGFKIINQANPITVEGLNWEGYWGTSTFYNIGDIVNFNGTAYISIVEHTSDVFATDLVDGKWQVFSESTLPDQTSKNGKFLKTNGTDESWESVLSSDVSYTPSGSGAVTTTVQNKLQAYISVKDFGAAGDGVTDDTTAIALAYTALPSTGGCLYFPTGVYAIASALTFTNAKPLVIKGDGQFASQIKPTFTTGDALIVNGTSMFAFVDCGIVSTASRVTTTYLLHILNCTRPVVTNAYFNSTTGGLLMLEAVNFTQLSQLQGDTGNGTALRIKSSGGTVSNVYFRAGAAQSSPSLWITGQTTSLKITNCGFAGGGPHSKWSIASIVSGASNFTVTTTATHDFQAGDYLVIRGVTPTTYNNAWRIESVTASTVVVNSTLNPGTSSVNGTAESMSACGYVSNEDGAANESSITNVLFEAQQPNVYGTVGLYFDGRRGVALAKSAIAGWNIGDVYTDYGATGIILSGDKANSGADPTVSGFTIDSVICSSTTRGILLDRVMGVTISNSNCHGQGTIVGDWIGSNVTAGIHIYAGPAVAPTTQGITISGGNYGMPRNWASGASTTVFYGAIVLDSPGIQDLVVTGVNGFGSSQPVVELNSPLSASARWKFKDCSFNLGSWPPTNTSYIPSVGSSTSLNNYPYHTLQHVTGTTNIQTIGQGFIGREVTFLFTSALSLVTGGNLAITANYSVAAGQLVNLVFNGTSWYVK